MKGLISELDKLWRIKIRRCEHPEKGSNSLAQLAFLEVETTCLWQRWRMAPSDASRKPDVTRWVAMDAGPMRWMLAPSDASRTYDVTRLAAIDARPIGCF